MNPASSSALPALTRQGYVINHEFGSNEDLFLLPQGSYLHSFALSEGVAVVSDTTTQAVHIQRWDLERLVKTALRDRLKERVWNLNELCHNLHHLRPCLLSATSNHCPRPGCSQLHVATSPHESTITYNNLVRIHVLHIMIFHTLYATDIPYHILIEKQE